MAGRWRRFISGLRALRYRDRLDRELDDELREFVRMAADRDVAAGMRADEALRSARARFGSLESVKERVRDVGWESTIASVVQDARYAVRLLVRQPGFTLVAVLALALGIGVNTAVFTAYKAMVARPIDARDPGRMVNIALTRQSGAAGITFSYPDYVAYRDAARSFSGFIACSLEFLRLSHAGEVVSQRASAAASGLGKLGLLSPGAGNAEFANTFVVSENYFAVLGVAALRGRTFEALDAAELAASPSVLISENYWRTRFAGDPGVIGSTVHLNGVEVRVIGMTPRDFVGTGISVPDFWLPAGLEPLIHADDTLLRNREDQRFRLFGRLAPGASIAQAQGEMALLADAQRVQHDPHTDAAKPATVLVWRASPFPLPLDQYTGLTQAIVLIMAAAAMVLVVACANVGSLQLARARSRQGELRTRLSLGAGRRRLIRQLLTESALLGLVAGATALGFTWVFLKVAVHEVSGAVPVEYGTLVFDVAPDLSIFAYVFGVSLLSGILFGVMPAMEGSASALAVTDRTSTSPARSRRLQDALVAAQVALSLVLLIAGSLFIRSSIQSLQADAGYDGARVVDLEFQFPDASKYTADRKTTLVREFRARLAALPGVTAITSALPPDRNALQTAAVPLDGASPISLAASLLHYTCVQPNYFPTLGIPVLLGRSFAPEDAQNGRVVIVSEAAAAQFWPGQSPIGRRLRLGAVDERLQFNARELQADGPAYQVIGVVRNTRGVQFNGSDSRQIYVPLADDRILSHPLLARTEMDAAPLITAVDSVAASVDPDLAVTASTLDDRLRQAGPFVVSSLSAAVALTVGLVGLVLAAMGVHGTVSYVVAMRTREVGIRMAIGAQRRDILRLILGDSLRPVLAGLSVGLLLAVGASYLLRGVLFGVGTVDSVSFGSVSMLFLVIALLAAYTPSRRALRVNPLVALRYE